MPEEKNKKTSRFNKKTIFILIFALIGVGLVCGVISLAIGILLYRQYVPTRPDGAYDQTKIQSITYANYWVYMTGEDDEALREVTDMNAFYDMDDEYLRSCGGIAHAGYYLETSSGDEIRTQDELMDYLGKIDSPEDAIAYIYAIKCDIADRYGDERQFVNKHEDGYLVSVISFNTFGCGNHSNKRIDFLVEENGDYRELKRVKLERGEEYCAD